MSVDLKRKNKYVMPSIEAAGHEVYTRDGIIQSTDDVAVQAIVDGYDAIPEAKADQRRAIKEEAAARAALVYEFIGTLGESSTSSSISFYDFTEDMYLTTQAAARRPLDGRLLEFKNIRDAAAAAISTVNGFTTLGEVLDYDPVTDPAWP